MSSNGGHSNITVCYIQPWVNHVNATPYLITPNDRGDPTFGYCIVKSKVHVSGDIDGDEVLRVYGRLSGMRPYTIS